MANERKSGDLAVPDIADDPAERKRVLNVLAQRRYRKRKKEHLRSLQEQSADHRETSNKSRTSDSSNIDSTFAMPHEILEPGLNDDSEEVVRMSLPQPDVIPPMPGTIPSPWSPYQTLPFLSPSLLPQELLTPSMPANDLDSILCISPPSFSLGALGPLQEDNEGHRSLGLGRSQNAYSLSDQLQMHQSSTFTFPDDHLIEIPPLALLKASMAVGMRLKIAEILWDISATSPFYQGRGQADCGDSQSPPSLASLSSASSPIDGRPETDSIDISTLPDHFRPTVSQRLIPHHPLLDLFPWPGTRDKLIHVFSLPIALRPRAAQDPMGLFRLVYDAEDAGGEGIRVQGPDPFDKDGWEIGQMVFERWWWAFENDIVDHSNRARKNRGEKGLALPGV